MEKLLEALSTQDVPSVMKALESLGSSQQRKVIDLYFGLRGNSSHSLAQIGRLLDRPKERIREIKNIALDKLWKALCSAEAEKV